MNNSARTALIVLSVFALINVMFVPIFDVWGGLFPSDPSADFFEVMEIFLDEGEWSYWVVRLTVCIFIPTLIMFIASLSGNKGFAVTSTVLGLVGWIGPMLEYATYYEDGFEMIFDFEEGSIAIGTWIALGIYVACFFVAVSAKKPKASPAYTGVPYTPQGLNGAYPTPYGAPTTHYCPDCGEKFETPVAFCGICGHKF